MSVIVVTDPATFLRSFSPRHKRRITEYLLSHFTSCGLPGVKLFLVVLLERVSDRIKAEVLSPTIQALMDKERAPEWEKLFGPQFEEFASTTISALDSSVSGHLNDTSRALWPVFLDTIKFYFQPGKYSSSDPVRFLTRFRVACSTERGALQKLAKRSIYQPFPRSSDRAVRVDHHHRLWVFRCCEITPSLNDYVVMIQLLQKSYCVPLLAKLLSEARLIVQLVTKLQPKPKDTPSRATKRTKVAE